MCVCALQTDVSALEAQVRDKRAREEAEKELEALQGKCVKCVGIFVATCHYQSGVLRV